MQLRSIDSWSIEINFDRSILQVTQKVAETAEQIREKQKQNLEHHTEAQITEKWNKNLSN